MNTGKKQKITELTEEVCEWPTFKEFFESTYPDSELNLTDEEVESELSAFLEKFQQTK